jgi:hypothetical protein
MNYGNENARQKLTWDDVALIRAAFRERRRLLDEAAKLSNDKLADKFGVTASYIDRIWRMGARNT